MHLQSLQQNGLQPLMQFVLFQNQGDMVVDLRIMILHLSLHLGFRLSLNFILSKTISDYNAPQKV